MHPSPLKRRRGDVKLNEVELVNALDDAISSRGNAELAVLDLVNRYDMHLVDLGRILLGAYSPHSH
jgi:hypothetical protein